MSVKEVNSKKFDAIMNKSISLNKCPKCPNLGGDIIVPMVAYSRTTRRVFIRCKYCGYETKSYDATTSLVDENRRFGSFVIDKSLMGAIHNAVNDWNGGSGKWTDLNNALFAKD